MKKQANSEKTREEYDFSGGVRGKYTERYRERTNVVVLDPDVAEAFPDAESVNHALRALAKISSNERRTRRRKLCRSRGNIWS